MNKEGREHWQAIVGYEGIYDVSSAGRIRRVAPGPGTWPGRILKAYVSGWGYLWVSLSRQGQQRFHSVHRLVASAFIGVPGRGDEVNHRDGDKTNNCPQNLEWTTPLGNMAHARQLGLLPNRSGSANSRAKVNEVDVPIIRKLHGSLSYTGIAQRYGVHKTTIQAICQRRSWSHVA